MENKYPEWPEHQELDFEQLPPFFELILSKLEHRYIPILNANARGIEHIAFQKKKKILFSF